MSGAEVFIKHEYQQVTGSFKERGACNRLLLLTPAERARGVAASAGNHALGLAYHGQRLGVPVHVLMPRFAPMVKVAQCRDYGAVVELSGDSFERARRGRRASRERRAHPVHGFDDPRVIEGQGSIGLELCDAPPELDVIVVPAGGGRPARGCGAGGEEPASRGRADRGGGRDAPTLSEALAAGHPVPVQVKPGLADGLAGARWRALLPDRPEPGLAHRARRRSRDRRGHRAPDGGRKGRG